MSDMSVVRRTSWKVITSGTAVVMMAFAGSAWAVDIPGGLPGNVLPNPDMETITRFTDHINDPGIPNMNNWADYWHHSQNATWSNGTTDPVVSGVHSLFIFDNTAAGPFSKEEFRSFATDIPIDPATGMIATSLSFRWNWAYDITGGIDPRFNALFRFSNAPNFSLDLGPPVLQVPVFTDKPNTADPITGDLLFEQQDITIAIPAGALTYDILFQTADNSGAGGGVDSTGTMFIDDVTVSLTAPVITLAGDLNGDGFVGINDLNIVLGAWNQNVPPANPLADPSGDGFVGIDDLNTVLGNWNAGTPPGAGAAVPEPATLALLGLGGLAMLKRRRA